MLFQASRDITSCLELGNTLFSPPRAEEMNNNNNKEMTLWRSYLLAKHVLLTSLTKSSSLCLEYLLLYEEIVLLPLLNNSGIYKVIFFWKAKKLCLWGLETQDRYVSMSGIQEWKWQIFSVAAQPRWQWGCLDPGWYSAWDKGLMREVVCYSFKRVVKGNTSFTSHDLRYSD